LRPRGRSAQEEDLEPAVLDPPHVRDDARHRHEGRGRKDGSVRIRIGQPFAFPVNDRALHVEPADKLCSLVGHEGRAIAKRGHERRRYFSPDHIAPYFRPRRADPHEFEQPTCSLP
jgi:hypothetical protein